MSTPRWCGVALILALAAAGCGSSDPLTPSASCEQTTSARCARYYACYTPDEISAAGLPATEADCVTMMEADEACAQETVASACSGNGTYHADEASMCVDQISALPCSQLHDLNTAAPACGKICS
jgi:hypothetical protein